jgi:hypothetical protein
MAVIFLKISFDFSKSNIQKELFHPQKILPSHNAKNPNSAFEFQTSTMVPNLLDR